ncbi:uncharacterized protein N7473_011333 [Penicillium subrubescens]|uniref:uncharacterized protein n=1 Tax=Penicillium subrubescens TaxID=1316194 RepID=UPI002544ED10|nr:uncharacterized protein N7473_011333 [Penicillium subrubescens]KAJ5880280.1 hypothetical protein N7473_011333 [Penicillium subrubescens]
MSVANASRRGGGGEDETRVFEEAQQASLSTKAKESPSAKPTNPCGGENSVDVGTSSPTHDGVAPRRKF